MGHAAISNNTPFARDVTFMADEAGRPLLVIIVKATYDIHKGQRLKLAEQQLDICPAGQRYGDSDTASYKYEPELAFFKPATDVVLIGHALAPSRGTTEMTVRLSLGPVAKTVRVVGDRFWMGEGGGARMTVPQPFVSVPLAYERAFGGWDDTVATDPFVDSAEHDAFEPRNPVGVGYRRSGGHFVEGTRLPNLEDPEVPIRAYGDAPPPACFGFVSPEWQPRAALAGSYDDSWVAERMPLLAEDFDRRFFNAASSGLVAPGHLRGNESLLVEGVSRSAPIALRLPGESPPACRVRLRDDDRRLETKLDTVIVNADDSQLLMLWRAHTPLRRGPHDVEAVEIG